MLLRGEKTTGKVGEENLIRLFVVCSAIDTPSSHRFFLTSFFCNDSSGVVVFHFILNPLNIIRNVARTEFQLSIEFGHVKRIHAKENETGRKLFNEVEREERNWFFLRVFFYFYALMKTSNTQNFLSMSRLTHKKWTEMFMTHERWENWAWKKNW